MTWLHCHPDDGSIVTCSTDEDFNQANASSEMKKNFVNVYTEMTIKEARLYKRPLEDSDGKILQKRQWKMDLHEIVPECHHECITDRGEEVPLICDIECRRDGEIKSYATKDDIVKIAR